jgi:cell division protein FtsA
MQIEKIIVGLDIGTTKVCAIVGRLDQYGKLEVLGMGRAISDGVKDGIIANINRTTEAIKQAIEEAEKNSGIDIKVVNVGIAGKHIRSSVHHGSITRKTDEEEITLDDVNRLTNDMYRIVTDPGNEIIHVIPQHYTVDYEENIKDPIGMAGIKLEGDFHIITANINAIRNLRRCVQLADLEVESVILEPLASSMAVLSDEEKEAGVALIDIGGGTTDIAIFCDGIIRHTSVIPFGGNIITSDIKQGCSIMQQQAEQLKVKFGMSLAEKAPENEVVSIPSLRDREPKEISIRNLAHIIEARMEEIVDLVHSDLIKSGFANKLAGGIVVTGGGSQLQNICQLFELKTGLNVRIGHPNEFLGKAKDEAVKSPMYATGMGLVLAGFKSIDEREENYLRNAKFLPPNMTSQISQQTTVKKAESGGDFFSSLVEKAKSFLIDDYDDDDKNRKY